MFYGTSVLIAILFTYPSSNRLLITALEDCGITLANALEKYVASTAILCRYVCMYLKGIFYALCFILYNISDQQDTTKRTWRKHDFFSNHKCACTLQYKDIRHLKSFYCHTLCVKSHFLSNHSKWQTRSECSHSSFICGDSSNTLPLGFIPSVALHF